RRQASTSSGPKTVPRLIVPSLPVGGTKLACWALIPQHNEVLFTYPGPTYARRRVVHTFFGQHVLGWAERGSASVPRSAKTAEVHCPTLSRTVAFLVVARGSLVC